MDGIAVRADNAATDSASTDSAPSPRRLAASAFAWIDTGDPLPAGMDTVVERERVRIDADGSAWITGPAPRGRHVRAVGEDFQAGQMLIPSGRWLRPASSYRARSLPGRPLTVLDLRKLAGHRVPRRPGAG